MSLGLLACLVAGATATATAGQPGFGFNDDFSTDPSWVLADVHTLSTPAPAIAVTDQACRWSRIESVEGTYDFSACDAVYNSELAYNIKPMFIVWDAPEWARPTGWSGEPGEAYPPDPSYDSNWSAFVAAMVKRYPQAAGFEIWNEPNNCQSVQCEWGGGAVDPVRYASLLSEAASAAHKALDRAVVIAAAPAPIVSSTGIYGGNEDWQAYLSTMLGACCKSGNPNIKAFGEHDYPAAGDAAYVAQQVASQDAWIRSALTSHHLNQPIWMTEGGFSTAYMSEATQSTDDQALYSQLATDNVAEAIFQQAWDGSWGVSDPTYQSYGFWRVDGSAKPVVAAMNALLHPSKSHH